MFLEIYYVHAGACDVRGNVFLAVEGCSGAFQAFLMAFKEGLDLFVSMKRVCFGAIMIIVRLPICDSVWSGLPTLSIDVIDGAKNLE